MKTSQFPVPRQFWIMRIPEYISGKDPVKYIPTRADAVPLCCCGQSASEARRSLSVLTEFAKSKNSNPETNTRETHFIVVFRSKQIRSNLAETIGRLPTSTSLPNPEPKPAPFISAQVTLSWDGASLKIEAPGRNGARQKVDGILFEELPFELRLHLIAELEKSRDRTRNELMRLQGRNIDHVASSPGMGINFVKKIWPGEKIVSRTLRARVAKVGQFDPDTQRIKTEPKSKEKEILNLKLDLDL